MKVPNGWNKALLHHVADVQTGLSKSENRTGSFVKKPYLRVANVQDGHLDLTEIKEINVPISQVERFGLQMNDVLLTEGGDFDKLGRGCVWRNEIPGCVHQNHIFAVRVIKPEVMLPQFLACQIQSAHAKNYFLSCAKQTTNLASINSSQIKELPVLLPPIDEQREMVHAGSIWDAAIQNTEHLIAAKNQLLSHLREHHLIKPKQSTQIKLKAATRESSARNGKRIGRDAIMAVTKQVGLRPMREETISATVDRYKVVRPNAFAYNPMRLNIGSIAISSFDDDVLVSPDYVVFECDEAQLLPGYLNHLRRTRLWASHFEAAGSGGVRIRIYYDDLGAFAFALPPVAEQARVLAVLDAGVAEIEVLGHYLAALKTQKRGLMQKLLTGQWRVTVPASMKVSDV